jgi:hypothetical protein
MKDEMQKRLDSLRSEYAAGEKALAELVAKEDAVRETLVRIGGAIKVLEDELGYQGKERTGPVVRPAAVRKK